MPNAYFSQLWLDAQKDLEKLLEIDRNLQESKPIENPQEAINKATELYYRYRIIVHRLTTCHDQMVQPQIRELAGKMLDYSIVRMLEFRREAVGLTLTECPFSPNALIEMKLTPMDVDLRAPVRDAAARDAEFARRRKYVEDSIANARRRKQEETASSSMTTIRSSITFNDSKSTLGSKKRPRRGKSRAASVISQSIKETPEEKAAREAVEAESRGIVLIQSHERARVSRRDSKKAERQRELDKKRASGELIERKVDEGERAKAAVVIQKNWRAFVARREAARRIAKLEEVIGMTMPAWRSRNVYRRCKEGFDDTLRAQMEAAQKLHEITEKEKERIWEVRGPSLVEDIQSEIREWFLLWFNELGYFDYIPPAEVGGSLLISTGEVRTPKEYLAELAAAALPDKQQKQDADDGFDEVDDMLAPEPEGWILQESQAFPFLEETNREFKEQWSLRREQILDPKAGLIIDLVRDRLCYKLQLEMRAVADESMRLELSELNRALLLDHANDEIKFNLPTPQQFEGQPTEEAPTKEKEDTSLEDVQASPDELLVNLTKWKVIREPPECRLDNWPGVESYGLRENRHEVRIGDVKQPLMDYCVLPMTSKAVHELAPLVKSACICGPPGCGQVFLARAVCTELKATVFDLTPEKHVGRFMGKETQSKLVHAVITAAKAYAPSVVLVESEKAWLNKLPPEMRRVQPKRFAPIYKKIVQGIKPGDQVLFLTASTEPYKAGRPFVRFHDKFIIVPAADYGTAYLAYKKPLMSHAAIDRHLDVSCLAKLAAGLTPHEIIRQAVDGAVPVARRMDFRRRPLKQPEILEKVLEVDSPSGKDLEDFDKFWGKLWPEKKRRELERERLAAAAMEKEKKDKKKK